MRKSIYFYGLVSSLFVFSCENTQETTELTEKAVNEIQIQENDSLVSVIKDNQEITLSKKYGGRVASLKLNGNEFLYTSNPEGNWGSTFWVSPQAIWFWPPPKGFDKVPYQYTKQESVAKFEGMDSVNTKIAFLKQYTIDTISKAFLLSYTMTNKDSVAKVVAPWEITRVPYGGITFFPKGEIIHSGVQLKDTLETSWLYGKSLNFEGKDTKVFADASKGWIAHLQKNMLLVKVFENIDSKKDSPNEETEIEIYLSKGNYIEVEQQGKKSKLNPKEFYTWNVKWFLVEVPANIKTNEISAELLALAAQFEKK